MNDEIDGCKQGKRGSETVPSDENAGDTGFGADFVDGFEQIISYAVVIVEKALVHLAVGTFLERRVNASEFEICNPISERLASAEANYNDFVLVIESDEALNVNTGFIGPGCLEVTSKLLDAAWQEGQVHALISSRLQLATFAKWRAS